MNFQAFAPLIGAGLGALMGRHFTPHYQPHAPVSAAALDAATIPALQRQANAQLAAYNGRMGAKGGINSADMFNRANLMYQNGQRAAEQRARDMIAANQSYNNYIDSMNKVRQQGFSNLLAGGIAGAKLGGMFNQQPSEADKLLQLYKLQLQGSK